MPGTRTSGRRRSLIAVYIVLAAGVVATIFPIYWILVAAFDPVGSLATQKVIPDQISLDNFRRLFTDPDVPYTRWFVNSAEVSVITTVLAVVFSTMAAYGFSRFRFAGRRALLKTIVLLQVFPNLLLVVALFLLVQQVGQVWKFLGLNGHPALILVYAGALLGGNIWLMKGFMDTIPGDIDDAAKIDGASHPRIFLGIMVPLIRPMIAVNAVLAFTATYSEVLIAQVLLKDVRKLTLPVGLYTFSLQPYSSNWGLFAAGALLAALPPLILFYLLQNWLISGLTQGAVKS